MFHSGWGYYLKFTQGDIFAKTRKGILRFLYKLFPNQQARGMTFKSHNVFTATTYTSFIIPNTCQKLHHKQYRLSFTLALLTEILQNELKSWTFGFTIMKNVGFGFGRYLTRSGQFKVRHKTTGACLRLWSWSWSPSSYFMKIWWMEKSITSNNWMNICQLEVVLRWTLTWTIASLIMSTQRGLKWILFSNPNHLVSIKRGSISNKPTLKWN